MTRTWMLYLDASVFGGVFDVREGFDKDSRRVIDTIREGRAKLLYSSVLERELEFAPEAVKHLYASIREEHKLLIHVTSEVVKLSRAYLDAKVVGPKWLDDTLHIAAASVFRADAIVSWNFKHMVRLDRIQAYNEVNTRMGYGHITILSPMEVNFNEG